MEIAEFKRKVIESNIPDSMYSLDQGLKVDAYNLIRNYRVWEFFYLDERGNRNDFTPFNNEGQAIDCLWKKIEEEMRYPPSIPPKGVFPDPK